ncbi:MAG: AhpC/TSA family protein [Bacteroidetes bacterium]|nr:MAG: AhpC/TSA family protein [Bacteroidota bacterium]TAG86404.1 MAG: AhpC/TSA family protein [Bacteroidota bacterium]
MKNNIFFYNFLLLLFFTFFSCNQTENKSQNNIITIKGKVNTNQKGMIRLEKYGDGGIFELVKEVELKGQNFEIQVTIPQPEFYQIHYLGIKDIPLALTGEEKEVEISINHQKNNISHKIKGSKDSEYYGELNGIFAEMRQKKMQLEKKYQDSQSKSEELKNQIVEEFKKSQIENVDNLKKFITKIQPSLVCIVAANSLVAEEHYDFLKKMGENCQKKYPNSHYIKSFLGKLTEIGVNLEKSKHLAIGQPAPEIDLPTPEGKNIKLSSLKGKIILVDFWASWCRPCRMENPNVVKLYNLHKEKGFEILGVSLDRDKQGWVDAIEKDKLTWLHISDLQFWQSAVVKTYQIQGIPATYLIDKNGIIIAKNLRGEALAEKLKEIL